MQSVAAIYQKGKTLYEQQYKYKPEDHGKYLLVDNESGQMRIANRLEDLMRNLPPESALFRIGFKSVFSIS